MPEQRHGVPCTPLSTVKFNPTASSSWGRMSQLRAYTSPTEGAVTGKKSFAGEIAGCAALPTPLPRWRRASSAARHCLLRPQSDGLLCRPCPAPPASIGPAPPASSVPLRLLRPAQAAPLRCDPSSCSRSQHLPPPVAGGH